MWQRLLRPMAWSVFYATTVCIFGWIIPGLSPLAGFYSTALIAQVAEQFESHICVYWQCFDENFMLNFPFVLSLLFIDCFTPPRSSFRCRLWLSLVAMFLWIVRWSTWLTWLGLSASFSTLFNLYPLGPSSTSCTAFPAVLVVRFRTKVAERISKFLVLSDHSFAFFDLLVSFLDSLLSEARH